MASHLKGVVYSYRLEDLESEFVFSNLAHLQISPWYLQPKSWFVYTVGRPLSRDVCIYYLFGSSSYQ